MKDDVERSATLGAAASSQAGSPPVAPETAPHEFLNRELQWLRFNERVLHQALDAREPLLERVRFLAIFSSNLDEFFMKRVGGLRRQLDAGVDAAGYDERLSTADLLDAIRRAVIPLTQRKAQGYRNEIRPALAAAGIELLAYRDLAPEERASVQAWYRENVFPILTPLAVDSGHRFPYISNLSVSLGIRLRHPGDPDPVFARVKIPEIVPQWLRVGQGLRFVALLDVVEHNLQDLFPGMEILKILPFRITRNTDIEGDPDDAEDLLNQVQQALRERRFAPVVRMQIARKPSPSLLRFLCEAMEIGERDIYETEGLIHFSSLYEIADLPLAEHRHAPWTPVIPPRLSDAEQSIFTVIRKGDVLVHHPYESFDHSVERFIEEAASDPDVLGIKQALYRTSRDSPFIPELVRAAEAGKQVAVLVELRARFDEERNIGWARKLEDAGVHVAHGVVGLKTHTKITLVVRREPDGLRCYAHIGTGNYHSRTARLYEDVGLLTCDRLITKDIVDLFNSITGRSWQQGYHKLLVAPHQMKRRFLELIDREISHHAAGRPARIVAKMNQLQDRDVIRSLYRASSAGVEIDLVVRGFCTLRPRVPGLSERISVISIVGRFLEHSRIFWFANGREDPIEGEFYIGSADWMYRNLERRVETSCPVEDKSLRQRLWAILEICRADRRLAWEMQPDGSYVRRETTGLASDDPALLGAHRIFMNMALESTRSAYE